MIERSSNYTVNASCLLCNSPTLDTVMMLARTPLANALEANSARFQSRPTDTYPLHLALCVDCAHLQLGISVDPALLFRDYTYTSPPGMRVHWKQHTAQMLPRFGLKQNSLIVEIGSNNGDLLRFYKDAGMQVLGFEPALDIARYAEASGIPTVEGFFNSVNGRRWTSEPKARLVLANNVFAHIRDLEDVMKGVASIMAPDGVFIAEVQYRGALLDGGYFDMIYHEHMHYHAVAPLYAFFNRLGFHLFDVQKIDTHGGSIRLFVQKLDGPESETRAVSTFIEQEAAVPWKIRIDAFVDKVNGAKLGFRQRLDDFTWAHLNGGNSIPKVVMLGCPAKLTTLAYHFGLKADEIQYVCDDAETKIGKLTPGHRWPIVPFDRLLTDPPALAIVAAWNYSDVLIQRVRTMFAAKGRPAPYFLIPFPTPQVIP